MLTRILMRNLKISVLSSSVPKLQLSQINFSNSSVKNLSSHPTYLKSEGLKKKTVILPKITLLSGDDLTVTTLEDAQKLAKRRDLKLVKIVDIDTKTNRPLFKLMTAAEYHQEDLKQREKKKAEKQKSPFKGEKVLIVGQNISQHDLATHCSKIIKWLSKRYEVRMVINGDADNMKKAESVYSFLEDNLKSYGRIVQKRQKGSDIKLQVLPPKEDKPSSDSKKTEEQENI